MTKLVIATVAEKGGGKGLFVKLVRKLLLPYRVEAVRFSDPLREILAVLDLEESRENLSTLATALRSSFQTESVLTRAMRKKLRDLDAADVIILDGLRRRLEMPLVKELNGIIVYINADQKIRFERRRQRPENADEQNMSWEQFLNQEYLPTETEIRDIGKTMADVTIENNGTVEEFETKIKEFLYQYKLLPLQSV